MSEPTDKPLDDQLPDGELDEYLKGDSSVSRQYRQLHSAEVPAELDRVVLRQAHDAVKTAPAKSRTWTRWSGPLALAASAVLVVSIVMETGVQDEVTLTAEKATAPATPQMEPQVEAKRQRKAEESEAVENDAAAGSAAIEAPRVRRSAPPEPASVAQDRAVPQDSASSPVYVMTPDPELSQPMIMESAPPAEKVEMPSPQIRRELLNVSPPPVAAPASAPRAEADTQEIVVTGNAAASRPISAPLPQYSDPERWLQDIRQLRKDNKQEQADREWRRFREAFPDHPVSETDAAREVAR